MKNPIKLLTIAASFVLAATAQAESHQHKHHSAAVPDCEKAQAQQHCAKTISSIFDQHGRLWTAWTNDQFVYVNYSDDNGLHFSQPVKVNMTGENIAAGNEHRPKIRTSQDGTIYLSWTTKLAKRYTGNIRFSRSADNGKSFSAPTTINDDHNIISHRFDALGVNNKGHIYISWLDKRDQQAAKQSGREYNGAAAYYAVSTDNGNTFSENQKLADNSCECCRMAIDFDKNDLPVIAWRHVYGDHIRDHAIVSFTDTHTPSAPQRMSHDEWKINGCPHHGPSLSIDSQNRYHAVWFNNAEQRHGIFYAHSDDQGKTFSQPVQIGNYDKQASHADIINTENQVYIVWQEQHNNLSKVFFQVSEDSGNSWSAVKDISQTSSAADYPFLLKKGKNIFMSRQIPGQRYKLITLNRD